MSSSGSAAKPTLVVSALAFELAGLISEDLKGIHPVVTGMGQQKAKSGLERALKEIRPRRIIAVGLCGGLAPGEVIGSLAVPSSIVAQGKEAGIICETLPGLDHRGVLVTVPGPVTTPAAKADLRKATMADWVDMESYAWAEVARERGIPFAVMRVVVDSWDEFLPNLGSPRSWSSALSLPQRSFQARRKLHQEARRVLCEL